MLSLNPKCVTEVLLRVDKYCVITWIRFLILYDISEILLLTHATMMVTNFCWFILWFMLHWLMFSRMMSDYNVEMINDGLSEFNVEFHGPKESIARLSPLSNMHFIVVDGIAIIRLWVCMSIIGLQMNNLANLPAV